jgi:molybdopterin-guanine dinucleotide biosynthesis protein A
VRASWTAVVLAGGRSTRLGHDKTQATISGSSLVRRVVGAVPPEVPCVIVGPDPGVLPRSTLVTIEDPPGGGPVAGIAAGLDLVDSALVAVIAVDMPFAVPVVMDLVMRLADAQPDVDGFIARDASGRDQPLAGAYRTAALRTALTTFDSPAGRSVRALISELRLSIAHIATPAALLDIDTGADLAAARRSVPIGERGEMVMEDRTMDDWVAAAVAALGIEQDVDIDLILDLARDAAHGVARPAAPVTTFLLGCAVGSGMSVQDAAGRLTALAKEWPSAE